MQLTTWQIEFYRDSRDKVPVLEFIQSLQDVEQAAVLRAIDLLEEFGLRLGMPHARPVQHGLWELRACASRVFYFAHTGRRFILLHGYRKHGPKAPQREVDVARQRWVDWKDRDR